MQIIGTYSIPIIICSAAFILLLSRSNMFDSFLEGCREGLNTSVRILPTMIILVCAVRMFSASGALEMLCSFLGKLTEPLGLPKEILPVVIMRPVSGSGATAMTDNLFSEYGPDSFAGRCASIIMGSSDTIIYTLSMYFGAAEITRTRYAIPASFVLLIFCVIISVLLTFLFF